MVNPMIFLLSAWSVASAVPRVALMPVAEGLRQPVHATGAGDGSGRIFITEQDGRILVLKGGKVLEKPFLDLRGGKRRIEGRGEKGLLSVAFHPRFKDNGKFYVNYTSEAGGLHSVVSEFKAAPGADAADADSERVLLTVGQPYSNHNGGQNAFGPDGFLYIGFGDGGSANDPKDNGQNLDTLLGKILRIDVDRTEAGKPYGIPPDNPFVKRKGARPEIFAWGLRNPWRFAFDPPTGRLYAGDVGQDDWEEIDVIMKGANYGWRIMEGAHCTPEVGEGCSTKGFELPIHEYGRREGISVTGGFVYRGNAIPELRGRYVFGDYGSGRIWSLGEDARPGMPATALVPESGANISSFGLDDDGELYVVDHGGRLLKLSPKK